MSQLRNQDDSAPIVQVGEVIGGKFRVDRVLGEGGMGIVVAATHLQLEETVALKFLTRSAMRHPETVARFAKEARAAVKLKGEHIARVFDVGVREDGAPYIVMEYLVGHDLAVLVRGGPLPIEDCMDFVTQTCEGLAEAHARGIIHRDVKPANIFIVEHADGWRSTKILDFGISKGALGDAEPHGVSSSGMNVKTSYTIGSPAYMPPEQMRAAYSVDARADIWSLGAVLYELLSGRPPFDPQMTLPELVVAILEQPVAPLRSLRPEIPAELESAVARCLEKDPANRFASVAELALALAPFGSKRARIAAEHAAAMMTSAGISSTPLRVPSNVPPALGTARTAAAPSLELSKSISAALGPVAIRTPSDVRSTSGAQRAQVTNSSLRSGGDKRSGFEMTLDEAHHIVRMRLWGFWSIEVARAFCDSIIAFGERFSGAPWVILCDSRKFVAQRPEVAVLRQETMVRLGTLGCVRIAVVVETAVYSMQFKRISEASKMEGGVFQDDATAMAWLQEALPSH